MNNMPHSLFMIFPLVSIVLATSLNAQDTLLTPSPSTERQDSLIHLGTVLHDNGQFNDAIKIYEQVLAENPSNMVALYEMSYTYFASKEYQKSISISKEGAKYRSKYLPRFFLNIGNALDYLGQPTEALQAYRSGITQAPDDYLLPFNLGVALYNMNEFDSARYYFHRALLINSDHPGTNLALGSLYQHLHKRIPAVFALSRFLILESNSPRAHDALERLKDELESGVSEQDVSHIQLTITPDSDAVDGYLTPLELALTISRAARYTDEEKGKSDLQLTVSEFQNLFQIMLEIHDKDTLSGFCWVHFAPYFMSMQQNGHTEAFVYYIFRSSNDSEVEDWLRDNSDRVNSFLSWSKSYSFAE